MRLKYLISLVICFLLSGCISAPSPGKNESYWKLQTGSLEHKNPETKPRYISKESFEKLQKSTQK